MQEPEATAAPPGAQISPKMDYGPHIKLLINYWRLGFIEKLIEICYLLDFRAPEKHFYWIDF